MAERRNARRTVNNRIYRTEGSAALQPQRVEYPRRKQATRRQRVVQPAYVPTRVRQPEPVSPLAIIGLCAVVIAAMLVIGSWVKLNALNTEIVSYTSQLSELKVEQSKLEAQYEKMFDMQAIEDEMTAGGRMIQPSSKQTVYMELSEPDSSEVFTHSSKLLSTIAEKLNGLLEFFR